MPFSPVDAPNVSDAAANQIRELIALDVLRPSDALPGERELGERMGISRTSIRAALQTLITEGLLVSKRGKGLRVAEKMGATISDPIITLLDSLPKARNDFFKFRIILECACVAETAINASQAERDEISRLHEQLLGSIDKENLEAASLADVEFHMAIIEASANVVSIQVARSLYDLMQKGVQKSHELSKENDEIWRVLARQHDDINNAVQARDGTRAATAMRQHIEYQRALSEKHFEDKSREQLVEKRRAWSAQSV